MTSFDIILGIIFVYLLIGNVLWAIGIHSYGGLRAYKELLKEQKTNMPMWFIYVVFVLFWPLFLKREG